MSEEKKEPTSPPKPEGRSGETENLKPQEATEAPKAEAKPAEKKARAKKEKPANCAGCNKSIRKKRWYYRNGKTYCTKRCWQTTEKKKKEEKAAAEKAAAEKTAAEKAEAEKTPADTPKPQA
ncbi:MAG: hypothetical protein NTW09_00985 [Candidatus Omnitrophica bacterium]|nr:hypothetical protein [Candidatus Omnitrophota bacterium]